MFGLDYYYFYVLPTLLCHGIRIRGKNDLNAARIT